MNHTSANLMTKADYARHRNVSASEVTRAIKRGKISVVVVGEKELIDPVVADAEWIKNSEAWRLKPEDQRDLPETVDDLNNQQGDLENRKNKKPPSYSDSRAYREHMKMQLAALELERQIGTYVKAEEVRKAIFSANKTIRDTFMALPDRISGPLASMSDVNEIHSYLTKEFHQLLENLVEANRW